MNVERRHLLHLGAFAAAAAALARFAPAWFVAEGRAAPSVAPPPAPAANPPPDRAGFYRLRRVAGVDWLVDPSGAETVSLGVNHVDPKLWLQRYNRADTLARYGTDFAADGTLNATGAGAKKWMAGVLGHLADWGFNSLGFHTPVPSALYADRVAWMARVQPICVTPYLPIVEYPDVFSPEVAARVNEGARAACSEAKRSANLLGYVFNDRPRYSLSGPRGQVGRHPWVAALQDQPAGTPGKAEWIAVLKARYASPAEAAAAHGVSAASWDSLAAITEWPRRTPGTAPSDDHQALLERIVERWFQLQFEAVRRHDPDHLIFGDKLGGGGAASAGIPAASHPAIPDYLYPILAKYVDVVTIEWSGRFEDQVAALRTIHEKTGKPILLGDSAFAVIQPRQEGSSKGVIVATQAAVGDEYAAYLKAALAEPYVLGWHFCGYIEGWAQQGSRFPPQNGFLDPMEVVHEDAVSRVRAANSQAVAWHRAPR